MNRPNRGKQQKDLKNAFDVARERGTAKAESILSGPDMLSADKFAKRIGAARQTVHNKRKAGEVLALKSAKRGYRFPDWQLTDEGRLLPCLPQLSALLGNDPWRVFRFLLQRHPELSGKRAVDAMKAGRVDEALDVARAVDEGAFS